MNTLPKIYVLVGPTASGKTHLGVEVARRLNGVVISADSRQVYTGLNIGTAKPPELYSTTTHEVTEPEMLEGIPHYCFNIKDINERYYLANWQQDAFKLIDRALQAQQTPIIVGGTMLYVDSVAFNFSIPAVPPNEDFRREREKWDVETLYSQLIREDPRSANFVERGNKRRIIRALEVMASTGQPFSAQRLQHEPKYDVTWIGLFPGFATLEQRIAQRIKEMITSGLVAETKKLQEQYGINAPLLKTINYAQAAANLAGQLTETELITKMTQANVRYTHRQMSWWRNNPVINWYTSAEDFLAQ